MTRGNEEHEEWLADREAMRAEHAEKMGASHREKPKPQEEEPRRESVNPHARMDAEEEEEDIDIEEASD